MNDYEHHLQSRLGEFRRVIEAIKRGDDLPRDDYDMPIPPPEQIEVAAAELTKCQKIKANLPALFRKFVTVCMFGVFFYRFAWPKIGPQIMQYIEDLQA